MSVYCDKNPLHTIPGFAPHLQMPSDPLHMMDLGITLHIFGDIMSLITKTLHPEWARGQNSKSGMLTGRVQHISMTEVWNQLAERL